MTLGHAHNIGAVARKAFYERVPVSVQFFVSIRELTKLPVVQLDFRFFQDGVEYGGNAIVALHPDFAHYPRGFFWEQLSHEARLLGDVAAHTKNSVTKAA